MHVYLKVKISSLAAESRIIRSLELKRRAYLRRTTGVAGDTAFWGLRKHRTWDVRREARSSCLAYGFLRGRPYRALEEKCYSKPDWKRVQYLIERYGEGDKRSLVQKFSEWKDVPALSTEPT